MAFRHMRNMFALALLAAALAVGAGTRASLAATTAPAPGPGTGGQFGIELLQVPVSEADNPRARQYIIDQLAPGTVIHREFEVANLSDQAMQLAIYPAAASISNGAFQFASGHTQNEMTTWVTISQGSVDLAPHARATLTATIAVPRDAPPGEQYGVIWAERDTKGSGNVTFVSRVGIRLYLSIGSGGAAAPDFTLGVPTAYRAPSGSPVIHLPVHNTGGRALDLHGTLNLSDGPGGLQAGPFQAASVITIAPGQSYQDTFVLSRALPAGPWQARFTLVSGLITRTETVTLSFNAAAAATAATAAAAKSSFPVVAVVTGAAAAVVIIVVVLLLLARRRRSRVASTEPGQPTKPTTLLH
jgi:hypothetical protein